MFDTANFVDTFWSDQVLSSLAAYIQIPCQSPAFDAAWDANGLLDLAFRHLHDWTSARLRDVVGATVEIVQIEGRTPVLLATVPGEGPHVLIYGHADKQPPMNGWTNDRKPYEPSFEGDRLYGRAGADDGYAVYSAVTAIRAVQAQGVELPRISILIEGSEESGSGDLAAYLLYLADEIRSVDIVIALDAGCLDYDGAWLTTSLRGQVAGTLSVKTLTQAAHSGDLSGIVPSSFRIARQLLSRLEDEVTGRIRVQEFYAQIPSLLEEHARSAGRALGNKVLAGLPLADGVAAVDPDSATLLLNRAWRPQLTVTGFEGLPAVAQASAAMHPETRLKLSLRLPPSCEAELAGETLKKLLEKDPPNHAEVTFELEMVSQGWHSNPLSASLTASLEAAARKSFGTGLAFFGGGGGIPFLKMVEDAFPDSQVIVTGVLGPGANAHGPDEFLHVPTAKRLTSMLAFFLADLGSNKTMRGVL